MNFPSDFSALPERLFLANAALPGNWEQWVDSLSTPVSIAMIGAGLLGLIFGWLVGRSQRRELESSTRSGEAAGIPAGNDELQWRHEKLVLLERQEADLQDRVQGFVADLESRDLPLPATIRASLFGVAEQMRELRQRVGSDLSRLACVRDRIGAIRKSGGPRPDALAACIDMAERQLDRLCEARDELREPTLAFAALEAEWAGRKEISREEREQLDAKLEKLEEGLRRLPADLPHLAEDTDARIRDVLRAGGEPEFDSIRDILLVDGAVTASRHGREWRPAESVARLRALLRDCRDLREPDSAGTSSIEETSTQRRVEEMRDSAPVANGFALPLKPKPMVPESGFQESHSPPANGSSIGESESTSRRNEKVEPAPPGSGEWIVFRSNRVEDWGRDFYEGRNRRARVVEGAPDWAEWVRMVRVDTGERVFVPAELFVRSTDECSASLGFNASMEEFYGALHLGVFADFCPNEVETRFTYGGWGFGHRVSDGEEGEEEPQASGWGGREIPADTVFEIGFLARLPEDAIEDEVLRAPEGSETFGPELILRPSR